jgi:hypothetical protein
MSTPTAARVSNGNAAHWYQRDGTPMHFVERSDGKGTRPATLRDARKLGLLPSPTSILKVLRAPQLEAWLIEQACLAVLTAPRKEGEELDAFVERVLHTERQQDEQAQKARDLGTQIHAAIEAVLTGEQCPKELEPFVMPSIERIKVLGIVSSTEIVVVGKDYAGRVDCIIEGTATTVLDFKTTGAVKLPNQGYWEHQLQTAAYAMALYPQRNPLQTAVLYISTRTPGECALCISADWSAAWQSFEHLLKYWQIANDYNPAAIAGRMGV